METSRSESADIKQHLRALGLRPTRQRVAIARLLLRGGHRHLSADDVLAEARRAEIPVAQTTIYNILRQFADVGLVREVLVESGRAWFDTRTSPHVHVYDEVTGAIQDLDHDPHALGLPENLNLPADVEVKDVSVVVRVSYKSK